jgi:hypothetical protein
MKTDEQLIAEYIATKGVTKCPTMVANALPPHMLHMKKRLKEAEKKGDGYSMKNQLPYLSIKEIDGFLMDQPV